MKAWRVAFVAPRFGPGVVGGSEAVTQEIAVGFAGRGWDVEVLTTCATDHYSWQNALPPGASWERGVVVRRFPTVGQWSDAARRTQLQIQADRVPSLDEQLDWLGWRFTVPGLHDHLVRRGDDYDAFVFSPYLFWTTTVCLPQVAERAVSIPCLHDETYARLDVTRPALSAPARVWFLSEPEHLLAHRLAPLPAAHRVTGAGVDVPAAYHPDAFRERHHLERPFLAYIARREPEKGWDWLLGLYGELRASGGPEVDLVTAGVGEVVVPAALRDRVIDLGRISDEERNDCMAAALASVQASRMESFSRTTMESWLAGTPVLAVEDGEVIAWHCQRSGGGLLFRDAPSLTDAVRRLLDHPDEAAELGQRGRRYVLANYSWEVVLDSMEADLQEMLSEARPRAAGATATSAATATGVAASTTGAGPAPSTEEGWTAPTVLVIGSYPPVPTTGTPVTVGVVAALRAAGAEPVVASYRVSAAPLHSRVAGPLAARRLANLRRLTGASRVVVVVERGAPLPSGRVPAPLRPHLQRLVARSLSRELAAASHVTLVVAGDPGIEPRAWEVLAGAADELRREEGDRAPLVGPLGPPDRSAYRPARLARRAVHSLLGRLLGPAAPRAVAALAGMSRSLRRGLRSR